MAMSDNKKKIAEWEALREKLNKATRKNDRDLIIELCHEIIKLGNKEKFLNIKVFLFYKDLGEVYFKQEDYKNALDNFNIAKEGLLKYRATERLKFPEDWLNELRMIDKFIAKIRTVYFD